MEETSYMRHMHSLH